MIKSFEPGILNGNFIDNVPDYFMAEDPWIVEYHYGNGTNDIEVTTHKTRLAAIEYTSEFVSAKNAKYQLCQTAKHASDVLNMFDFFGDGVNPEESFTYVLIYHREESHFRSRLTK
ncbi:MAG: hypothetical protein WD512_06920 [Candidatus Paceibacterota bacterium]